MTTTIDNENEEMRERDNHPTKEQNKALMVLHCLIS